MEVWPNFFIVGAQKAGTTSLYEYLKNIPEIYMCPVKEPYFFSHELVKEHDKILNPIKEKKDYLNLFADVKNEKIIGEASVHYLPDPETPNLIHQKSPHAKILISLRDPVERVFSLYSMFLSRGFYELSFHDELAKELKQTTNYIEPTLRLNSGLYFESTKRYLDIFGEKQVKIIIFEEWQKNITKTINEILEFLDIDNSVDRIPKKIHNQYTGRIVPRGKLGKQLLENQIGIKFARKILPTSGRRFLQNKILLGKEPKPKMMSSDRDLLIKYYHDDVKKLQNLLGKKLSWENFFS